MSTRALTAYQVDYVRVKTAARELYPAWRMEPIGAFRLLASRTGCTMTDAYYFFHQVHKCPKVSALERRVNRMSPEDRQMVGTANTTVGSTKRKLVW
jgi:hypothetical protein